LKSTETSGDAADGTVTTLHFSNFGSLKSTETDRFRDLRLFGPRFQQFRLVEEH